ncbi:MAG: sigma-70 family RNA polymerase sigma factor [Deltaproteobacteria bacterium]|nr:sigma-70 family RNA polymerase sigma factor [Deltaproteobacteria bacterium]
MPSPAVDFRAVYEAEFAGVWHCLRRLGAQPRDVEDAVHDVFLVFHRCQGQYDPALPARAYLAGIAHRVAANRRRLAANRCEPHSSVAPRPGLAPTRSGRVPTSGPRPRARRLPPAWPPPPPTALPQMPTAAPVAAPAPAPEPPASASGRTNSSPGGRESELRAERTLLEMARTAQARGDGEGALRALEAHQLAFPRGQLAEERDALVVFALVGAGRTEEGRQAARRFRERHPRSLMGPSVEAVAPAD